MQGEKTSDSDESSSDDKEEETPATPEPKEDKTEESSEPAEGRKAEDIPESEISGKAAQDSLKQAEVSHAAASCQSKWDRV